MESDNTIHHRLLQLRDTAIVSGSENNSRLGYDCVTDALVAVYNECSAVPTLNKAKDVSRFLKTYKPAMEKLDNLRLREEDFFTVGVIGRGHFGEVRVVKEKSTNDIFAMKVMQKAHILQQADAAFFLEERDIMAYGQSQWLTKLHYAFQNEHSLYLVMDFHPGGDLFTIMERREGGMTVQEARFYTAEIIAGLHDLHNLGFAHRDVKPDNVLIARSGHIKLVDFGSASRLKDGNVADTALPVGTPEYISPEVLTSLDRKTKYGTSCDWWSVGIILYELLYDVTPFEGETTVQTYANIMNYKSTLTFPDNEISDKAKSLIQSLLVDSNNRLGYTNLLNHSFFTGTDWQNLAQVVPPIIPSLSGPDDLSNFDSYDDQDESKEILTVKNNTKMFSGRDLPFVGFSFMRWTESLDGTVHEATGQGDPGTESSVFTDLGNMASDIKRALEACQSELKDTKEINTSLEKECVIYKSQLEDLHRKLDVERHDRRVSDSKALQLLAEIRDQSKVAQNLRESQNKEANNQVEGAVAQLEQERLLAVKKAQRLREELKKKSLELDSASAKVSDLRAKLSKVMETSRREVDALQSKLTKVTESSRSRIGELQRENFESQDKLIRLEKQLDGLKTEKQKYENKLNTIKLTHTMDQDGEIQRQHKKIAELLKEKNGIEHKFRDALKGVEESSVMCKEVTTRLKLLEEQVHNLTRKNDQLEMSEVEMKRELQSSKSEIACLHKERKDLVTACEDLSTERDNKTSLLKKHEKTIDTLSSTKVFLESKTSELEALLSKQDATADETVQALQRHIDHLESERRTLKEKLEQVEEAVERASNTATENEDRRKKVKKLEGEIAELKQSLSETTSSALRNGEKVTELTSLKKELEGESSRLKASLAAQQERARVSLSQSEALTKQIEEKYTALLAKVDQMEETKQEEEKRSALMIRASSSNAESLEEEVLTLKSERDNAVANERNTAQSLMDFKKQFEAQELSFALLKRNVSSLEEELSEANTLIKEKDTACASLMDEKKVIEEDLDTAESRTDALNKQLKLEKEARSVLEQQTGDLRYRLEEITASNTEEVEQLKKDLSAQKQLAGQYSEKLAGLQQQYGLKELLYKETERSLEVERALTVKLYDDLHTIGREHGKLKASFLKVTKKLQNQEAELEEAAHEKEQALIEKATIKESMEFERSCLQTQIAQFNKLVEITPRIKTSKAKGLKLGRKKRDPAKEVDEWNKLRKAAKERGEGDLASFISPGSQSSVSVSVSQSEDSVMLPPCSVQLYKTPLKAMEMSITPRTTTTPSVSSSSSQRTGQKRTANSDGYCTMTHNIPHRWVSKSGPFHKSHSCVTCRGPIKHTQKYSKCSSCGIACHQQCVETTPNTCGLPQELAVQICPVSPRKKMKHEDTPTTVTTHSTDDQFSTEKEISCDKENVIRTSKRLSIDLIRCQVATPLSIPLGTRSTDVSEGNTTDLSITSSMLEESGSMDDSSSFV